MLHEKEALETFEDVENALVSYGREKTRSASPTRAVAVNRRALELAREFHTTGRLQTISPRRTLALHFLGPPREPLAGICTESPACLPGMQGTLGSPNAAPPLVALSKNVFAPPAATADNAASIRAGVSGANAASKRKERGEVATQRRKEVSFDRM